MVTYIQELREKKCRQSISYDSVKARLTDKQAGGMIKELIPGLEIVQIKSLLKVERDEVLIKI